ncbi:hypothetical protein BD413DRAFT_612596 [Trametes elegans]|nr:hypothetical protein BD413DRAFT_612596 [Trametes elegans]
MQLHTAALSDIPHRRPAVLKAHPSAHPRDAAHAAPVLRVPCHPPGEHSLEVSATWTPECPWVRDFVMYKPLQANGSPTSPPDTYRGSGVHRGLDASIAPVAGGIAGGLALFLVSAAVLFMWKRRRMRARFGQYDGPILPSDSPLGSPIAAGVNTTESAMSNVHSSVPYYMASLRDSATSPALTQSAYVSTATGKCGEAKSMPLSATDVGSSVGATSSGRRGRRAVSGGADGPPPYYQVEWGNCHEKGIRTGYDTGRILVA